MPTETQRLEQRVAALQSDLNARDQALDDAATENNERELSRRDWFDEAQRLQADLTSANADKEAYAQNAIDLRAKLETARAALRTEVEAGDSWRKEALGLQETLAERDALLDCLRNIATGEMTHNRNGECPDSIAGYDSRDIDCLACRALIAADRLLASAEPSSQVERDDRAEFEHAFVVQEGVFFSKERNEYRSMNGRSIEYTDATDLNLRLQGWQARAALERKP